MDEYEFTDEDLIREEMMDAQKHDDKLREMWEERRNSTVNILMETTTAEINNALSISLTGIVRPGSLRDDV